MKERTHFLLEYEAEPSTLKGYDYQLNYIESWLEEKGLDLKGLSVHQYKQFLIDKGWGRSTQRQNLSAVKAFLRWMKLKKHPLLKHSISKRDSGPQRTLSHKQRDELLRACKGKFALRDQAIIRVLWDTFIRKFEACGALLDHLDLENRVLWVETKAHPGKGRQWEQKRFGPRTHSALISWLEVRHTFANPGLKNLFVSNTCKALTPDGVSCIFKRLSQRVGFTVGAHDFRRGGATHALKKADSRYVMKQGGWKSTQVFLKYTEQVELDTFAELMWGADGY